MDFPEGIENVDINGNSLGSNRYELSKPSDLYSKILNCFQEVFASFLKTQLKQNLS